ncbi:MAG: delta-60 repeat domain-containing protein [Opitutaceae bacterium]
MGRNRSWKFFIAWFALTCGGRAQYWAADAGFAPVLEGTDVPDAPWIMAGPGGKCFVSAYAVNGIGAGRGAVRLSADGTIDSTFSFPAGSWGVLGVYPDGKVLAQQIVANDDRRVTRLLPDGSVDPTFTAISVSDRVSARVLDDGRILLFGYLTKAGGLPRIGLAVLDSSGVLSTTFVPGLTSPTRVIVEDALPLADGRFVVVGSFASAGTNTYNRIARLNADGSIDSTFTPDSNVFLSTLYRSPVEGTILAAWGSNLPSKTLVRLNAAGIRDPTFTPELVGSVYAFGEQQPDGKIYYVTTNNGWELRRIIADGTADAAFVVRLARNPSLPTVAADGTLFVPDSVTTERRTQRFLVSRLSSADGKFGGLRTANASYFATKGIAGVYAPGVNFSGPLFVGDIRAFDAATPTLVIGSSPDTRITGGDLFQENGRAVQVSGLTQLKFTSGGDSHGNAFVAKTNRARLEQNGIDVTNAILVNPTP